MAIISRRIPSSLGYLPNYTVRAHTVRGGLGGAESCGPTQQWDPNYVFQGIKGQCTPKGTPLASQSQWGAGITAALTSLWKPATPATSLPAYAPAPAGGMSRNTMIAIGLGAAGLLAIVMLTRK